jgi:hypothetical protein
LFGFRLRLCFRTPCGLGVAILLLANWLRLGRIPCIWVLNGDRSLRRAFFASHFQSVWGILKRVSRA